MIVGKPPTKLSDKTVMRQRVSQPDTVTQNGRNKTTSALARSGVVEKRRQEMLIIQRYAVVIVTVTTEEHVKMVGVVNSSGSTSSNGYLVTLL